MLWHERSLSEAPKYTHYLPSGWHPHLVGVGCQACACSLKRRARQPLACSQTRCLLTPGWSWLCSSPQTIHCTDPQTYLQVRRLRTCTRMPKRLFCKFWGSSGLGVHSAACRAGLLAHESVTTYLRLCRAGRRTARAHCLQQRPAACALFKGQPRPSVSHTERQTLARLRVGTELGNWALQFIFKGLCTLALYLSQRR